MVQSTSPRDSENNPSQQSDISIESLSQYRPLLKRILRQSVPQSLQARFDESDVVQETLLRGVVQFDKFTGTTDAEFVAWLSCILKNQMIDAIRMHQAGKRDSRREEQCSNNVALDADTPSHIVGHNERCCKLADCLLKLTESQRSILRWRSEGCEFSLIAQRLGCSADAARMQWGRTVVKLAQMLEHD